MRRSAQYIPLANAPSLIAHVITDKYLYSMPLYRQEISLPVLNEFKLWLDKNATTVMKGSALRKAIDYTLNQWQYLIGYCERGDLMNSNALAENAIRPFAIGRKNWLFADTRKGAEASAACYSLIETAKASNLDLQAYIKHTLDAHRDCRHPRKTRSITALECEARLSSVIASE